MIPNKHQHNSISTTNPITIDDLTRFVVVTPSIINPGQMIYSIDYCSLMLHTFNITNENNNINTIESSTPTITTPIKNRQISPKSIKSTRTPRQMKRKLLHNNNGNQINTDNVENVVNNILIPHLNHNNNHHHNTVNNTAAPSSFPTFQQIMLGQTNQSHFNPLLLSSSSSSDNDDDCDKNKKLNDYELPPLYDQLDLIIHVTPNEQCDSFRNTIPILNNNTIIENNNNTNSYEQNNTPLSILQYGECPRYDLYGEFDDQSCSSQLQQTNLNNNTVANNNTSNTNNNSNNNIDILSILTDRCDETKFRLRHYKNNNYFINNNEQPKHIYMLCNDTNNNYYCNINNNRNNMNSTNLSSISLKSAPLELQQSVPISHEFKLDHETTYQTPIKSIHNTTPQEQQLIVTQLPIDLTTTATVSCDGDENNNNNNNNEPIQFNHNNNLNNHSQYFSYQFDVLSTTSTTESYNSLQSVPNSEPLLFPLYQQQLYSTKTNNNNNNNIIINTNNSTNQDDVLIINNTSTQFSPMMNHTSFNNNQQSITNANLSPLLLPSKPTHTLSTQPLSLTRSSQSDPYSQQPIFNTHMNPSTTTTTSSQTSLDLIIPLTTNYSSNGQIITNNNTNNSTSIINPHSIGPKKLSNHSSSSLQFNEFNHRSNINMKHNIISTSTILTKPFENINNNDIDIKDDDKFKQLTSLFQHSTIQLFPIVDAITNNNDSISITDINTLSFNNALSTIDSSSSTKSTIPLSSLQSLSLQEPQYFQRDEAQQQQHQHSPSCTCIKSIPTPPPNHSISTFSSFKQLIELATQQHPTIPVSKRTMNQCKISTTTPDEDICPLHYRLNNQVHIPTHYNHTQPFNTKFLSQCSFLIAIFTTFYCIMIFFSFSLSYMVEPMSSHDLNTITNSIYSNGKTLTTFTLTPLLPILYSTLMNQTTLTNSPSTLFTITNSFNNNNNFASDIDYEELHVASSEFVENNSLQPQTSFSFFPFPTSTTIDNDISLPTNAAKIQQHLQSKSIQSSTTSTTTSLSSSRYNQFQSDNDLWSPIDINIQQTTFQQQSPVQNTLNYQEISYQSNSTFTKLRFVELEMTHNLDQLQSEPRELSHTSTSSLLLLPQPHIVTKQQQSLLSQEEPQQIIQVPHLQQRVVDSIAIGTNAAIDIATVMNSLNSQQQLQQQQSNQISSTILKSLPPIVHIDTIIDEITLDRPIITTKLPQATTLRSNSIDDSLQVRNIQSIISQLDYPPAGTDQSQSVLSQTLEKVETTLLSLLFNQHQQCNINDSQSVSLISSSSPITTTSQSIISDCHGLSSNISNIIPQQQVISQIDQLSIDDYQRVQQVQPPQQKQMNKSNQDYNVHIVISNQQPTSISTLQSTEPSEFVVIDDDDYPIQLQDDDIGIGAPAQEQQLSSSKQGLIRHHHEDDSIGGRPIIHHRIHIQKRQQRQQQPQQQSQQEDKTQLQDSVYQKLLHLQRLYDESIQLQQQEQKEKDDMILNDKHDQSNFQFQSISLSWRSTNQYHPVQKMFQVDHPIVAFAKLIQASFGAFMPKQV